MNQEQWNNASDLYSAFIDELQVKKGSTDSVFPRILKIIGKVKNKKIFDYGCGEGRLSRILYDLGSNVCAFDISESMIKKARDKNNSRNILYTSNSNSSDIFRNNYYDFVLGFMVLITIKRNNLSQTIDKIYRVLRKGGKAIFVNTNTDTLGHRFEDFYSEIKEENRKEGNPYKTSILASEGTLEVVDYYYSSTFLRELYLQSGFEIIHEETIEDQFLLQIVMKQLR